jgi:hypothetical protein
MMTGIASTVAPKSDQLNAEDLIAGPRTVRIREVRMSGAKDQPVWIFYDGVSGRPWKPCLTMRRLLIYAWGDQEQTYVGKWLRLYRDEKVKWAGEEYGGIRISHMSNIGDRPIKVALTVTRGHRAPYTVQPLSDQDEQRQEPQSEQPWIIMVSKHLAKLIRGPEWLKALQRACQACPTAGDLSVIQTHPTVKEAMSEAPPEVKTQIETMLREAAFRLANPDEGTAEQC